MPPTPSSPSAPRIVRPILIAIGLAMLAALVWHVRDALVIAFGGIVFATLLRRFAEPVSRWTKLSRRWSVIVVLLALILALTALVWFFGAQVAEQVRQFREQLPAAAEKVMDFVEKSPAGKSALEAVQSATSDGGAVSKLGVAVGAIIGGFGNFLLIVFVGAYFALDPDLYRRGLLALFPLERRPVIDRALHNAGSALGRWLVAQLIIMAAVGVLTGVGLGLLGVPLAFSLALLTGVLEFVPVIGPVVAAIPGLLLAFSKDPTTALYAGLVYIAVQQIESNLLTPLIQRWAVELPPVLALLSIVAGGLLFGPLGVLFATPLAVVVVSLTRDLYVKNALEGQMPKAAPA